MFYAGIGSRRTPPDILNLMERLGGALGLMGYTLRSGAAPGADSAFEQGALARGYPIEVYLPWYRFHERDGPGYILVNDPQVNEWAKRCVEAVHPAPHKLTKVAKMLMARNTYQVAGLGQGVLSEFVVCWTPDGVEEGDKTTQDTGGTGQAIRLASQWNIPVFNLQRSDTIDRLSQFLRLPKSPKGTK